MDYRILGPIEVLDDTGTPLALGGAKQRAVLAILLLHAGEVVSTDRLIDDLWGEDLPDTAANTIQVYVSQLRKVLRVGGAEPLVTTRPGYRLDVGPDELDLRRFERLVGAARDLFEADDAVGAALRFREALALWRGEPLADFSFEPFASEEVERLLEVRLVTIEDRYEAELEAGRHAELVPDLEALLRSHPHRERLRGHLMLASYRAGRQEEALRIYQEGADRLADELGIDPDPELRRLHEAILRQEDWLGAPTRRSLVPQAMAAVAEESFRLSEGEAVLITGVAVRLPPTQEGIPDGEWAVLATEFYGRVVRAAEAAGASILRTGGDGVDVGYGLPVSRPDDVARAAGLGLRAVAEARSFVEEVSRGWDGVVPEVRVGVRAARIGVDDDGQPRWVDPGDPVGAGAVATSGTGVVSDRATAGRLPLGWTWQGLDDDLVVLIGSDESFRLRSGTPFVGREAELTVGVEVLADVVAGRGRILLVEGEAGIGKTRLLEELRTGSSDVVWLDGSAALDVSGGSVADAVRAMLADAPLCVTVDDVHRLSPEQRASITELLAETDVAPLLVVMSLDPAGADHARDLWGTALTEYRHRVAHVVLGPLAEGDAIVLADALSPTGALDAATGRELVARAEGNPLYLEELIRSLSEAGGLERGSGWTLSMTSSWMMLPPSLESLLAGRIQRLPEGPRHLAQVAAVAGREFPVTLVAAVAAEGAVKDLSVLLRAEIVREVRRVPELVCSFRHRLLQDAALATLTPTRMRELYGQVGRAFEAAVPVPDAQQLERLAFYFYRSDDDEAALCYLDAASGTARGSRRKDLQARAVKVRARMEDPEF